jgi:hypothetical protein
LWVLKPVPGELAQLSKLIGGRRGVQERIGCRVDRFYSRQLIDVAVQAR